MRDAIHGVAGLLSMTGVDVGIDGEYFTFQAA